MIKEPLLGVVLFLKSLAINLNFYYINRMNEKKPWGTILLILAVIMIILWRG